ncbi:MAG: serine/threonine protein kinase, partial [Planctomycetales bacterium]|nr:serine/threonine protein kinase [Planctomycetales bacterium]
MAGTKNFLDVPGDMAKSRIGPFALEAPLSQRASSGQVFRGIHLEQRKLAALRIFPIPLGMTPESRSAFASQLEQLKQLRHRGIVRCYGGGFDTRKAYLAYELIDGESLRSVLARRQRLPWETALDYSQQLAEALQYAHQMGWIHGRLRPAKLLLSSDGTILISDWRREAITSMIGSAPPTQTQMQYTAPEVLAGGAADEKADLYALGAIIFTMLTGEPPYTASNPAQFLPHLMQSPIPSVSAQILDCPVWLNAIVEQLLAKDPKQRPFSAAALQLAFKEAQRRQAEGVGVLQHVTAGFSPLQLKGDRAEAEKVLGIKPKRKRKRADDSPFFEKPWVLVTALLLAVGAVVWFMLPLNEETLRRRANALLPPQSEEWIDWNTARDSYLTNLVERFPDGPHAEWAADQIRWVDAREAERRLERDERLGRKDNWTQAQIQYAEARQYEHFGDLATALDKFRAIVSLFR